MFPGDSEMARRCRALDWSATPLGAPERWPQSLRTAAALVLGSSFPMILVWGPELVQLYNDAYIPLIGQRHPAALGMPTHACWPGIRHLQEPIFQRVFAGETVHLHEAHYPLDRGEVVEDCYFDATFVPVPGEAGGVGGSVSTLFEVTGRVAARGLETERERLMEALEVERARLDQAFRLAPAYIAVVRGPDHVFEMVNPRYRRLTGGRELLGRPVREALPELIEQGYVALLDRVRETGDAHVEEEARVVHQVAGGPVDERFISFVYQPLRDARGGIAAILAHGVDVTEQVHARREVERLLAESERARADAERASRAKSDFLAVMSHELRTPLNAISGYADLLELGIHGPVTEAQRQALGRIQKSQQHLLGLINEVLNYAKLESGAVTYQIEDVPVRDALSATEALVEPQAHARAIAVSVRGCPPGVSVRADPEKLRQILLNLASNAIKFTDPGGRIDLECVAEEREVLLRIRDTGIGIPADRLESIFEPFVQIRSDLARTAEGTGLGLAISRDLARGMGGELAVQSTPGEGSVFSLRLPRGGAG